jgi:hypothetical protein
MYPSVRRLTWNHSSSELLNLRETRGKLNTGVELGADPR